MRPLGTHFWGVSRPHNGIYSSIDLGQIFSNMIGIYTSLGFSKGTKIAKGSSVLQGMNGAHKDGLRVGANLPLQPALRSWSHQSKPVGQKHLGSSGKAKHKLKQGLPRTNLMLLGFVGSDHCDVPWVAFLSQQCFTGSHHRSGLSHVLQGNLKGSCSAVW